MSTSRLVLAAAPLAASLSEEAAGGLGGRKGVGGVEGESERGGEVEGEGVE